MSSAEPKAKIKPKLNIKEPSKFKVIYINDEVTSMEFVVETLIMIFGYNESSAFDITKQIHEVGRRRNIQRRSQGTSHEALRRAAPLVFCCVQ